MLWVYVQYGLGGSKYGGAPVLVGLQLTHAGLIIPFDANDPDVTSRRGPLFQSMRNDSTGAEYPNDRRSVDSLPTTWVNIRFYEGDTLGGMPSLTVHQGNKYIGSERMVGRRSNIY